MSIELIFSWLLEYIGPILQIVGVLVVLIGQVLFIWRGYRKWGNLRGSLKKTFMHLTCPQLGLTEDQTKALDKKETDEKFKKYRLANWLREDFIISVFGLVLTLAGLILEFGTLPI